ncbi:MAG: malto-oligosyltrehalose trehalohydrolase [Gemmatimonadales bacterium]
MISVLERGATVRPDGSVRFSVWAPHARQVGVRLQRGRGVESFTLEPDSDAVHAGVVKDVEPGSDYYYVLDGQIERPDPVSRFRPGGVHGPTRIVSPDEHRWSDQEWRGRSPADLAIYELHVGTFTAEGTFDAVVERLPYLKELGITALEIMPVAEFPGGRNWGYDGVSLYAPQSSYGGPAGLKRLVDAAHGQGLAVLLDVVYNHLGPEGNYLGDFGPYFSDRHRTLWGQGWNLDGPDSDQVRRYLVDNALYWVTEFHLDGLRLDAADKIVDLGALHFLEEVVAAVGRQGEALGRRIFMIAESDANDPRFIRPPELGGYGFDAQWADDFHHAVHAALTGERQGYFADFGGVEPVAKVLAERFVNDGRYSPYRRRRYGRPAADLPGDRFVVCIQNHDQVGNRAAGERLSVLVSPEALRLGAAILLLSPYVPLLFMGEEYGEINPFLYFVSHGDPALVEAVRQGRRREFEAFAWSGKVCDPQSEETFRRSRLDWSRRRQPPNAALHSLYTDLLRVRWSEPALRPGRADASVSHDAGAGWVSLRLAAQGSVLMGLFNFANVPQPVPMPSPGAGLVLSTDHRRYGGMDRVAVRGQEALLPPLTAALVRGEPA